VFNLKKNKNSHAFAVIYFSPNYSLINPLKTKFF